MYDETWRSRLEVLYDPLGYRLHLSRDYDEMSIQYVTGRTDEASGALELEIRGNTDWAARPTGLVLRPGMVRPIYEALAEHFGPPPGNAESLAVDVLKSVLDVERARVDRTLSALLPKGTR